MFEMSVNEVPGWLVTIVPRLIGVPVAATPGWVPQDEASTVPALAPVPEAPAAGWLFASAGAATRDAAAAGQGRSGEGEGRGEHRRVPAASCSSGDRFLRVALVLGGAIMLSPRGGRGWVESVHGDHDLDRVRRPFASRIRRPRPRGPTGNDARKAGLGFRGRLSPGLSRRVNPRPSRCSSQERLFPFPGKCRAAAAPWLRTCRPPQPGRGAPQISVARFSTLVAPLVSTTSGGSSPPVQSRAWPMRSSFCAPGHGLGAEVLGQVAAGFGGVDGHDPGARAHDRGQHGQNPPIGPAPSTTTCWPART